VYYVKRALLAILLAVAAAYAGDYLVARLRGANALASVTVQPYYAVPLKDGKTEILVLDPENETCVKSLAPHFGFKPCWYLDGRREPKIQM
jgi:hypothetical protein